MKKKLFSYSIFILDLLINAFSFLLIAWIKSGTHRILETYWRPFLVFLAIWLCISLFNHKYSIRKKINLHQLVSSIIVTNIYITSLVFFLILIFRILYLSRLVVFGTILTASALEVLLFSILYYAFRFHLENPDFSRTDFITKSPKLETIEEIETSELHIPITKYYASDFEEIQPDQSIVDKLSRRYLAEQPRLLEFLGNNLDLLKFSSSKTSIFDSGNYFNIEFLEPNSQQLFINLHKANDFRRLNKYFIKVNENLVMGGVFVFKAETITQRLAKFMGKYGLVFGRFLYLFDFIFRRIFPKITMLQGIYFAITKGLNRALSRTEIIGRLYFCGFEIINMQEIGGFMYFIMKKIKAPSSDPSPSYGPLIQLKRYGKDGIPIYVYKIRTMHPYSEYLHDYMSEKFGFGEKGKIENDFRITSWGRVLRQLWLDEIPQFYNLFKGDLRLVGVRPLSARFLREYPEDLRQLRFKFKPGCLPPYVAYRKQQVEEYFDAERRYFMEKEKHPFWTDVKVLFMAVFNILAGKIRSE